jgi:outer membrane protein assembly factor BamB
VPYDQPDLTLDKIEKKEPIVEPVTTPTGVEMRRIGVRMTTYARNVRLNGEPVFERYYEKQYVGRLPAVKVKLLPGKHTVWPGDHVFSLGNDGKLSKESEDILVEGDVVRIKCYPVTLRAFQADPDAGPAKRIEKTVPLPNLTIRDARNYDAHLVAQERAKDKTQPQERVDILELVPEYDDFNPLTLWLPSNKAGKGYLLYPMGLTFHLSAEGVVPGAGEGRSVQGVSVKGNVIDVPLYGFPVTGQAETEALIQGVQKFQFSRGRTASSVTLYPRFERYVFRVAELGPAVEVDSDLKYLPFKGFRVDLADRLKGYRRGLVTEIARRHLAPGDALEAQVRGIDASPALEAAAPAGPAMSQSAEAADVINRVCASFAPFAQQLAQIQSSLEKSPKDAKAASDTARTFQEKLGPWDADCRRSSDALQALGASATASAERMSALKAEDAKALFANAATSAQDVRQRLEATIPGAKAALAKAAQVPELVETALKTDEPAATDKAKQAIAEAAAAFADLQQKWGPFLAETRKLSENLTGSQAMVAAAVSGLNGLADAQVFGQIQTYGASDWSDVTVSPASGGKAQVSVPDVPNGVYRLKLGLRPKSDLAAPIFTQQWVTIARKQRLAVGLFTPRGRDAFYQGETFWVGLEILTVGEPLPAGTALEATLSRKGWSTQVLARKTLTPIQERDKLVIRLDSEFTLALEPGRYSLTAKAGGQEARPLSLEIVDPTPRTHFTNLLVGKYNAFNGLYTSVFRNEEDAEMVAREIVDAGFNAFKGMNYDMDRVYRADTEIERLVAMRPELGPWEAYYQPSGRDKFLNAAVRNNLRFYENIFTYNDTSLPRHPGIIDACERYIGLEAASMRHSPAFQGVSLYDEIYGRSLCDPTGIVAAFDKACEVTYREKHPGLTSGLATKALDRFAGRPFGQRQYEDLVRFRTWPAHQDADWRVFSERLAGAVKDIVPYSENFTLQRFWGGSGGNVATNGTPYDVFGPLEVAACVMYKDGGIGDRPVFAPMQADVLRCRDNIRVWTQIHGFGCPGTYRAHYMRQAFFGLSQKIDGITYFTVPWSPDSPGQQDNRDTIRDIAGQLTTPYGDFLVSLDRGYKKVAVYYSRIADFLTLRKPNELSYTVEGLWVACIRAGFPADFLYDPQLLAGKGLEYEVIFAPGFQYEDECPPDILKSLQRLIDSGKTVVVEKSSKLPVEGIKRLDSELDEYDDKLGGAFPRYVDFESEMVWDRSEETTRIVREFLSKHIKPAAEHNLLVGPDWLKRGQGEYLILPNFAYTEFTGLYKTLYQAPDTPSLRFPARPAVCYDVLEMKRQDVQADGEWMSLQVDFRSYPGKLYAFLPKAISQVSLQATGSVQAGADMTYLVGVKDADGQAIDAAFPAEIKLTAPDGALAHHVYRAAAPEYRGVFRVPANAAPGQWSLRVRELVSGTSAEMPVQVTPGKLPAVALDERQVWMADGDRISRFLKEERTVVVALDDGQDWLKPEAEKLVDALKQRGLEASIKPVAALIRLPGPFNGDQPEIDGTRLWRGTVVQPGVFVDSALILLGKRNENGLIDAMLARGVLPQPLSDGFPGPGKALVNWSRRMFSNKHDTLSVLANDLAGIGAGVQAMLALDGTPKVEAPQSPVALPQPDPKAVLTAAKAVSASPSSFRDAISWEDWIRCIDVDEKTGRMLVGTFGYGDNLFCFDRDGKLVWKKFLPEHNVYRACWYDEGRRICAFTGRGFFLFLLDPADGRVLKKFGATEWPDYHGGFNAYQEGAVNTELDVTFNPPLRQILIHGRTGILAVDYDGKKMWLHDRAELITSYIAEAVQTSAAEFGQNCAVGNFALNADGSKLVYSEMRVVGSTVVNKQIVKVWAHRPQVLDARTGKLLLENDEDTGRQTGAGGWWVTWPKDSENPWIHTEDLSMPLLPNGKRGPITDKPKGNLKDGGLLRQDRHSLERLDPAGRLLWNLDEGHIWIPHLDRINAAETRYYRCDRDGLVRCTDLANGKTLWESRLPFNGQLCPVGDELLAGASDGTLAHLDASGKQLWRLRIREIKDMPGSNYPESVRSAVRRDPDSTHEFFLVGQDKPGEYDGILRFGVEQIENGNCESKDAWASEPGQLNYASPGHESQTAIALEPGQRAQQALKRRVVPSATYLLEFFYKLEGESAQVVAGALLAGEKTEHFTGPKLDARPGEWAFGRVAVKTLASTTGIVVGFEAQGGRVALDDVRFRPVRFPSANLLANSELSSIEPTFVKDIRVQYDRVPRTLREKLMRQNHVAAFLQGVPSTAVIYTQEQAFLHNGRLDDIGKMWTYQPDFVGFSAVLTKAAHVSHLVLYLHNGWPKTVYPAISILANNLQTKVPEQVALVRGNRRRFIVVHFPNPVYTDSIKVIPGPHRSHTESLTEVEIYGPLGGLKVGEKAFSKDTDAWPMFMGCPSHVPEKLPPDMVGEFVQLPSRVQSWVPCFNSGMTAADRLFTFSNPGGAVHSGKIPVPGEKDMNVDWGPTWPLETVTPTATPARYAGRLLVGSADYKLHAVADNGTYLWNFKTGGRVYSSPVPHGDDVYFGSDDGNVYKVDVDSGTLIWDFRTGDKVRSAPALVKGRVYFASWDGFLYCVDAEAGKEVWKAALGKFTRSSPAVHAGRVYIGDESGAMLCFDASNGGQVWKQELAGYVSCCPAVAADGAFFASEQGDAALVGLDGQVRWKRNLGERVTGQPVGTQSQVIVPTEKGLLVLRRSDGQRDDRFIPPGPLGRVNSVVRYGEYLCIVVGQFYTNYDNPPRTYAFHSSGVLVWSPKVVTGEVPDKKP